MMMCPKCGCEIDEMADCCSGCLMGIAQVQTRLTEANPKPTPADAERKRKPIAISLCGVENNSGTQCNWIAAVVCDDGSIWYSRDNESIWREMSLPEPEP